MTPYQRFQLIFKKWFPFTSNSIGLNILDKDFKFYHSIFVALLALSVLVFSLYTMLAFDVELFLKAPSILGLGLQVQLTLLFIKFVINCIVEYINNLRPVLKYTLT